MSAWNPTAIVLDMNTVCESTQEDAAAWEPDAVVLEEVTVDVASADDRDATAPVQRRIAEIDAAGIFPGVPFS
jgi:hypothetical protein